MPAQDSELAPLDVLPISIGIETLGGVNSILLPSGLHLPASRTEVFSTATDDQRSVEIHLVAGEAPHVRDNRSLGHARLEGIPPARRAVPQIEVCFRVDPDGAVTAVARDLGTGTQRSYSFLSLRAPADKDAAKRAQVKLFTSDLPFGVMPTTLAVRVTNGHSLPLVPRGARLPAQITETFSTSMDEQRTIMISLLLGERRDGPGNAPAGEIAVDRISAAPRGQSRITVTFLVDTLGNLFIDAKNGNGKPHPLVVHPQVALTDDDIERLLTQMQVAIDPQHAVDRTRWGLDAAVRRTRDLLTHAGPGLAQELRERCEQAMARAEQARNGQDLAAMRAADAALRAVSYETTDALYRAARAR